MVGYSVVKGMKDPVQRERVTFECIKDQDFSLTKVENVVTAAYQVIGQIGPFDPSTSMIGLPKPPEMTLTDGDWQKQILPSIL